MRLAPGAWNYAGVPAALALVLLVVYPPASLVALALVLGVLAFFRDPERTPADVTGGSDAGRDSDAGEESEGDGVLAAADGSVSVIREEDDDEGRERVRVGVFMNVTDVHVNRAPLPGTVADVEHVPGGHLPAFSKAAERNERLHVDVAGTNEYRVTLIAGTVARRCYSYVDAGETVSRGERIGHIAFSSRVDVLLPPRFARDDLRVEEGDTVHAGETVVADGPGRD